MFFLVFNVWCYLFPPFLSSSGRPCVWDRLMAAGDGSWFSFSFSFSIDFMFSFLLDVLDFMFLSGRVWLLVWIVCCSKPFRFGLVGCLRVWCRESYLSRGLVLWGASNMPTWRFSRHLRYFLFPLPIADHSHGLHYFSCILSAVCGCSCVVARVCFLMR